MLTQLIRMILRGLSVALAGTVAAVLFGPTLVANAATYFRHPVRMTAAIRETADEKARRDAAKTYVVTPRALSTLTAENPTLSPTITPSPSLPFTTPTSAITITPIAEATATPGVTPTAAAHDSQPVPSAADSPTAHATTDAPEPTHSATPTAKPSPVKSVVSSVTRAAKVAAVLAFARAQIGERYLMGGIGPNVWDCSGLTKAAFNVVGINIGTHSSNNQYQTAKSKGQLVPFSQKQAGDLVFYGTPGDIYHVAIYSGNGKIIEAANPARPVIERAYWGTPYSYVARPIR